MPVFKHEKDNNAEETHTKIRCKRRINHERQKKTDRKEEKKHSRLLMGKDYHYLITPFVI